MAREALKVRNKTSQNIMGAKNPINTLGHEFTTVQEAIDDLEDAGVGGTVIVPVGTWGEALTITGNDIILIGMGWGSIIDGATSGHAINISGDRCIVRDLQVKTTGGGTNAFDGVNISGTDCILDNVYSPDSDRYSVTAGGARTNISNCRLAGADLHIINVTAQTVVNGARIDSVTAGQNGVDITATGDNTTVTGSYIDGSGGTDAVTIDTNGENCVVVGNRASGGITDNSGTSTVANNDET